MSAAENLDEIPRLERDVFPAAANKPDLVKMHAEPDVDLRDVLFALSHVLRRAEMYTKHEVKFEPLSVRERMGNILSAVSERDGFIPFYELFIAEARGHPGQLELHDDEPFFPEAKVVQRELRKDEGFVAEAVVT